MSVTNSAASRLLVRSLAAASAKTSSHTAVASSSATRSSRSCHQQQQRSDFHTSAPLAKRRRPKFPNVKAPLRFLAETDSKKKVTPEIKSGVSPEYDDTDIETLKKNYTPEQLEAILLGEKFTPSEDLAFQGRLRRDPYRFRYLDDFSVVRPVIDKRPKSNRPVDPTARFMTPDEFGDDLLEHYRESSGEEEKPFGVDVDQALEMYEDMRSRMINKAPGEELTEDELFQSVNKIVGPVDIKDPNASKDENQKPTGDMKAPEDWTQEELDKLSDDEFAELIEKEQTKARDEDLEFYKYMNERNSMTGFDGGDTALAPDVPDKVPGVAGLYKASMTAEEEDLDPEGKYQDLKRQTGLTIKKIMKIYQTQTKVIVRRWVSNQTRLGKIRNTSILCIAGNNDGWLGLGEAKSVDGGIAEDKAKLLAIKNMRPIRRYENRTIYGTIEAKIGATVVRLESRPPGFGLRVSHRFFEMARLAGIHDLAVKMLRSRNPMNSVKACYQALVDQPDPELIAIGRGKKLVDARKVYHGGAVH